MSLETMNNSIKDVNTNRKQIVNFENKMTSREAAEYLGISPNTLNAWRSKKSFSIAYFRVGRLVYYAQSDLDDFLLSHKQING